MLELPVLEPPVFEPAVFEPSVLELPVFEPSVFEPSVLELPVFEPSVLELPVFEHIDPLLTVGGRLSRDPVVEPVKSTQGGRSSPCALIRLAGFRCADQRRFCRYCVSRRRA